MARRFESEVIYALREVLLDLNPEYDRQYTILSRYECSVDAQCSRLGCAGACSLRNQDLMMIVIFTVSVVVMVKDISYLKYMTVIWSSHWNERTPMNEHIFVV